MLPKRLEKEMFAKINKPKFTYNRFFITTNKLKRAMLGIRFLLYCTGPSRDVYSFNVYYNLFEIPQQAQGNANNIQILCNNNKVFYNIVSKKHYDDEYNTYAKVSARLEKAIVIRWGK